MIDSLPLPELLAPAGSEESLRAALAGGADAVYFGHSAFSNRMRAKNFTDDSIREAIRLCHDCGAAAHITVNTRIRDRERDDILRLLEILLGGAPDSRADALIVADLGVARMIKERYPHAVLHASTQTSLMSPSDCAVLSELGFSRLVIPRELSQTEIEKLVREASPMEIEMFIHGAHCVSLSGQCLMSYVQGGRSGNRGECAQPCRLPFSSDKCASSEEMLSLADMCLGKRITDIIASGVASLKIEGRLKSPGYVFGVTSIYRHLLDERRNATARDLQILSRLFTRGFTDGYFIGRYGKMNSSRVSGSSESSRSPQQSQAVSQLIKQRMADSRKKSKEENKIPLRAVFTLTKDAPATLTLICKDSSVTVCGEIPTQSTDKPLVASSAAKNLTKMGGTPYTLDESNIEFHIDEGLWMPVSAINALRRNAADTLAAAKSQNEPAKFTGLTPRVSSLPVPTSTEWVADFADLQLLGKGDTSSLGDRFDRISVPAHQTELAISLFGDVKKLCPSLPPFTPDDSHTRLLLGHIKRLGAVQVMCHTVGQIRLAEEAGLHAHMSFRANITGEAALSVYRDLGCASVTLSPELPAGAVKSLGKDIDKISVGCIAYGKFPVMTTARCLISGGKCPHGNFGGRVIGSSPKPHTCFTHITDRMGQSFPVIGQADCVNIIYNSTPVWMGDRLSEISRHNGGGFFLFMFTDESAEDAVRVVEQYARGERSVGRRI